MKRRLDTWLKLSQKWENKENEVWMSQWLDTNHISTTKWSLFPFHFKANSRLAHLNIPSMNSSNITLIYQSLRGVTGTQQWCQSDPSQAFAEGDPVCLFEGNDQFAADRTCLL
jgi:hypothetical protein